MDKHVLCLYRNVPEVELDEVNWNLHFFERRLQRLLDRITDRNVHVVPHHAHDRSQEVPARVHSLDTRHVLDALRYGRLLRQPPGEPRQSPQGQGGGGTGRRRLDPLDDPPLPVLVHAKRDVGRRGRDQDEVQVPEEGGRDVHRDEATGYQARAPRRVRRADLGHPAHRRVALPGREVAHALHLVHLRSPPLSVFSPAHDARAV
mmetsp:Transcript_30039/g.71476  ORF Transcript_30039/g.71476 Transcript_30039/m.71476 type:complete len:204 (-) Transcript_30039:16-627(-)